MNTLDEFIAIKQYVLILFERHSKGIRIPYEQQSRLSVALRSLNCFTYQSVRTA